MKKFFLLATAFSLAATVNAQAIYLPGEHDNVVAIAADDAVEDLERYPLQLTLTNPTVGICGVEIYMYIDDNSIQPWVWDEDNEDYDYDTNTKRVYKSTTVHMFKCEDDNPQYPGYFYTSIVDTKDFKLKEGTLLTFYIDTTRLANGSHTLHIVDPMCTYIGDDMNSASYFCSNQEINFTLSNGTLTIANGIKNINSSISDKNVYDLQGRIVMPACKGIYVQDGRKILK